MENTPQNQPKETSLLDTIIATSKEGEKEVSPLETISSWNESWNNGTNPPTPPPENSWENTPKKAKEQMSAGILLKGILSMLFVAIIFFGSFLSYIVFNPGEAQFFVTVFGIDPNDIAILLKKLINGSFWVIILALSIVWIISLFRAIWTPKEQKRKRMIAWLIAIGMWILLFAILTFWSYLFKIINTTNYSNPGGNIIVYDQNLFANPSTATLSQIRDTSNLIGPITLKFDISENASQIAKKNLIDITEYNINFDGAICNDGTANVRGSNPENEKWIICTFDTIKPYNIRWTYTTKDRLWKIWEVAIAITPVEIRWVLDIKEGENKDGKKIITLDAKKLEKLGNPRWMYGTSGKELDQPSISIEPTDTPTVLSLKLFWADIDRIFIIQNKDTSLSSGNIDIVFDTLNPLWVKATVGNIGNESSVTKIEWSLDDGSVICKWASTACEYAFGAYGKRKIIATVIYADGQKIKIEKDVIIDEPILLSRHAIVRDSIGNIKNNEDTFDAALRAYVIKDIVPPDTLSFDARSVVTENPGYSIDSISWKMTDGKTTEEKKWDKVSFDISGTRRYTIEWIYTFRRNGDTGDDALIKTAKDVVILDIENRFLTPKMNIDIPSDYVPVKITVDWSQSESENGEIKKFIYDFGDGKPPATGDAIQQYEYTTAWERDITLTIINSAGETATIKKKIVLKETPKTVWFTSSMSPGVVWTAVDFSAENTTGQVEDYIWTFGDNTPSDRGISVSHVFSKAWSYQVTLTVIYADWTQKQTAKTFKVDETLE